MESIAMPEVASIDSLNYFHNSYACTEDSDDELTHYDSPTYYQRRRSKHMETQTEILFRDIEKGEEPSNDDWTLSWHNLSYTISLAKKKGLASLISQEKPEQKCVISRMNGAINSGEVVAILGGSGAGKSTLLNCISGRLTSGKLSGQILLNGRERLASSWRKVCAYVEQDDLVSLSLTAPDVYQSHCI